MSNGYDDDTISKVDVPDTLAPSYDGVPAPARELAVLVPEIHDTSFLPDGDGLHWYERLRVAIWGAEEKVWLVVTIYELKNSVNDLLTSIKEIPMGPFSPDKIKSSVTGVVTVVAALFSHFVLALPTEVTGAVSMLGIVIAALFAHLSVQNFWLLIAAAAVTVLQFAVPLLPGPIHAAGAGLLGLLLFFVKDQNLSDLLNPANVVLTPKPMAPPPAK